MQSHSLDACGNLTLSHHRSLPIIRRLLVPLRPPPRVSLPLRISCGSIPGRRRRLRAGNRRSKDEDAAAPVLKTRKKDNVWSVDNDLAAKASAEAVNSHGPSRYKRRKGKRGKAEGVGRGARDVRVLVSGPMLMEIETVLQTQEPVIKPSWDTFASSISGIWKGVGAVFSPATAEIEPIGVGSQNEDLYDCYTLSRIEKASDDVHGSRIHRKTNWVTLNPFGETLKHRRGDISNDKNRKVEKVTFDDNDAIGDLPTFESFDFASSEVMDEDFMGMEPGLIFFEDGSYSRGPVEIPVGEFHGSDYFLAPTFKFEQCLVKGCHKRLRIVHTIEFSEAGSNIQIVRVAMYEEQWASPTSIVYEDDAVFDLKPISERKRTQPSELTGSWKVFEVSAIPVFTEETNAEGGLPFVYLCTETLKKRNLPGSTVFFGEEEAPDMQDVTVLWLPGGVAAYVDVNKDGVLTIGVSWYSDEGINLVMERDYGMDGNLKEVRLKTEVKRRWTDPWTESSKK